MNQGNVVIRTRDLVKRYGSFVAVDRLNLEIYEGETFGLLGPNGAGKTTTILMLLGLTEPSEGSVQVVGLDPTRDPLGVKKVVGYLPDRVGFYEDLTGKENLLYTAALNGIPRKQAEERVNELLERVGLAEVADRKAGGYSRGMLQRLGLADALVKKPRIVILDEPTLGIDPEGVRQMLQFITQLSKEERVTVLLASHLLHQVQQVCDRVGIFVRGKIVALGCVEELSSQLFKDEPYVLEVRAQPTTEELIRNLKGITGVDAVEQAGDTLLLHCMSDARGEVAKVIYQSGTSLLHLAVRGRSLDEIYRRYFLTAEEQTHRRAG
ncbi:MAG TPA: ABC transporter ATP-binding protein [Firmicutes bacterium]|nr:ABC transporter ATP-binding protein [Bacillota bacterium]